jgi:hypothetical protein
VALEGVVFTKNERTIIRKEADGAYLYDPDSGELLHINSVATTLYELCDGKHTREEVIAEIKDCYDTPMDALGKDVIGFLDSMIERSLINKIAREEPESPVENGKNINDYGS